MAGVRTRGAASSSSKVSKTRPNTLTDSNLGLAETMNIGNSCGCWRSLHLAAIHANRCGAVAAHISRGSASAAQRWCGDYMGAAAIITEPSLCVRDRG
jgi:hypothetical protein